MIVFGVDPGLFMCGYAFIFYDSNKYLLKDFGVIETKKEANKEKRLQKIYDEVINLIKKFKPSSIAIEEIFFYKNKKNALIISQVQAVILLAAAKYSIPVSEYTPTTIKKAVTGVGFAKKRQVEFMIKNLLNLKDDIKIDDVADACACAICHIVVSSVESFIPA